MKASITTPRYKWGSVNHNSTGVVTNISPNGTDVTVDFPMQGKTDFFGFKKQILTILN